MKLIIVESPTKAKTIERFLGKDYKVISSFGHVRDLPKSKMGIDTENNFEPKYITPVKARPHVKQLQEAAKRVSEIILASDEDREGEAIAWHIAHTLKISVQNAKRIVFHEITKKAIEEALKNPRMLDINLVNAQQARRILDRLVGYELSPFLWKTVRRGLSAGRVQSVALRLIVEREKERLSFQKKSFFEIEADIRKKNSEDIFRVQLTQIDGKKIATIEPITLFAGTYKNTFSSILSESDAEKIISDMHSSKLIVEKIESKDTRRTPPPPFTTSTLQQAAINQTGFSAKQTMRTAQKLYEKGLITYMRTDSVNLSLESIVSAKKIIEKLYGAEYAFPSPRIFKKNSASRAQEAHEAIRPTQPSRTPESLQSTLDSAEQKLYELIWNRMIASQMTDAVIKSTSVHLQASGSKNLYILSAHGSTIAFQGFLKVYKKTSFSITDTILPDLAIGEEMLWKQIFPIAKETSAPPRYTEASLVKTLEERGIGRPSTYAPTISTLFDRSYIDRDESKRLFPMEVGSLVSNLLSEHFHTIVDIGFTANMEDSLDEIAAGNKDWQPVIKDFYDPFHALLENKKKQVKKEDVLEKVGKNCPECQKDLVLRYGRFGKFISCSGFPDCRYTEKTGEEKQLEKEFLGEKCEKCGGNMTVKRGKFGSFLGCSAYPECKNIKKIQKSTGIQCPKCSSGDIVERKSKGGRIFYGCETYPKCDFSLWSKPTGEKCTLCESLIVYGAKDTTRCSNKECVAKKSSSL